MIRLALLTRSRLGPWVNDVRQKALVGPAPYSSKEHRERQTEADNPGAQRTEVRAATPA
jgi:hypothetical protein